MCLPNYTKRFAQSQSHKLSEDQHKLAAELTLGLCLLCIRASGWQGFGRKQRTRFTAEANHARAAVCPICFPGNRCILEGNLKGIPLKMIYREWTAETGKKKSFLQFRKKQSLRKTPKCAAAERRCDTTVTHMQIMCGCRFFIFFYQQFAKKKDTVFVEKVRRISVWSFTRQIYAKICSIGLCLSKYTSMYHVFLMFNPLYERMALSFFLILFLNESVH